MLHEAGSRAAESSRWPLQWLCSSNPVTQFTASGHALRMSDFPVIPADPCDAAAPGDSRFPRAVSLDAYLLGIVDFDSFVVLQDRLADELVQTSSTGRERGVLLVCEHPPILTFGRDASVTDLAVPEEEFVARGIATRWLARGGGAILQAPGQLSISVLLEVGEDARLAVVVRDALLAALREVAAEFHVGTTADLGDPSVLVARCGWVGRTTLAARDGVTRHGAVLNVSPRMDWQRLVSGGPRVSCLGAERQRVTPISSVREAIVRRASARLGGDTYHVHTGHPWLKRTRRLVEVG
jgi:lipoyl(octanoyl) transferase